MKTQSEIAIKKLTTAKNAQSVMVLSVDDVHPDPDQPRKKFSDESIVELSQSIENSGQRLPIEVVDDGEKYIILTGERRWRACKLTAARTVRAILVQDTQTISEKLINQIIENVQREDFETIDLANAYKQLLDDPASGITSMSALAARVGKSEATIFRVMKVLELPPEIQQLVADGKAGVDAAIDLGMIAKVSPTVATELIGKAEEKGLLQRKDTREAKDKLKIESKKGKPKGQFSDIKGFLNKAIDFVNQEDLDSAIVKINEALEAIQEAQDNGG